MEQPKKNCYLLFTGFSKWVWCWLWCPWTPSWISRKLPKPEYTTGVFPFRHQKRFHFSGRTTLEINYPYLFLPCL